MEVAQAVGMELRHQREKSALSQEKLAFEASVHRTYISLIERGINTPTLATMFRICRALNMTPSQFVRNVEERIAQNKV